MTVTLWVVAGLLIVLGVIGTVVPAMPGPTLVFGGMLLAAWIDSFDRVGWLTVSVLGLLTFTTVGVDVLAASLGAGRLGASRLAIVGAIAGTVLGLFAGLPGLIIGPFVGAVAGELLAGRDLERAGRVGVGTWLGLAVGVAMKIGLVFAMLGIFATAYLL
ncbi:MAG: DUF456 family protein [Vicinamibacterales bacterium]|jgi:hypothetical protein|nr:hypothetical protein [Acidobacteriota bacterium]MDP7293935.1 DUF456 family protein [Vicinamibacterales bacterium]MDP7473343.1 DUF456 family protein [Vicinamibacterales bacterium]MDP7670802.1 DUF456 family protein [Vicinamibacterales bacterium]HJO37809.1 DUF456 family protein [Vicinamibacterales bacterium]|tara:strand:+ start:289 stop:768 length:480 start_codon:yes stop_codon:yes gene_type:complete